LVADPSILFLDEPTSGLDSTTSKLVMQVLKDVSRLGIPVIVVLHQPRYEIFQMFDDVLLLAKGGRTVYSGPTSNCLAYFEDELGFKLQPRVNPADFFMDVIAGEVKHDQRVFDQEFLPTFWAQRKEEKNQPLLSIHSVQENVPLLGVGQSQILKVNTESNLPGFWSQTWNIFSRTVLQMKRNVKTEVSDLFLMMLASTVVGFMFRASNIIDIARADYTVVLSVSIVAMQQSLRLFGTERVVFWRECSSGLNIGAYFLGKTLASLIYLIVLPLVYLLMFYGFNAPRSKLGWFYFVLLVGYFTAMSCGHFISTMMSPQKAQLCAVVVALLLGLLDGFSPTLPELDAMGFLGTAAYSVSFARYQLEAFVLCEVDNLNPVFNDQLDFLFSNFGWKRGHFVIDMVSLFCLGIAFKIFTFLALKYNRGQES